MSSRSNELTYNVAKKKGFVAVSVLLRADPSEQSCVHTYPEISWQEDQDGLTKIRGIKDFIVCQEQSLKRCNFFQLANIVHFQKSFPPWVPAQLIPNCFNSFYKVVFNQQSIRCSLGHFKVLCSPTLDKNTISLTFNLITITLNATL